MLDIGLDKTYIPCRTHFFISRVIEDQATRGPGDQGTRRGVKIRT